MIKSLYKSVYTKWRRGKCMFLTADFETTTDPDDCRVWAFGICAIDDTYKFTHGNSIEGFMEYCEKCNNDTLYFHNLKFDGEFILYYLFQNGFTHIKDRKQMKEKTFTTLISGTGQFYSIVICFSKSGHHTNKITIYDSLKILPFSVDVIAKGFNLSISKLKIDYDEKREIGHILTLPEIDYLRNDVEIMARALKVLFDQGLDKMTQGSNALFDYKRIVALKNFIKWFPVPDYDKDIRQSYKGGFTYLNPAYKEKDIGEGIVLDVNSLYPSVMYNELLPYGVGRYFKGEYKPDKLYNLHIQMLTCQFELKKDHIPTIQLKNNLAFIPTEYVTSSHDDNITLCLTSVDLELFFDHYEVFNVVYHDGWKFKSTNKLFKDYIDKWIKIKNDSTLNGNKAMRTLAKLMLNALYGKFALNPIVSSKFPTYQNCLIKYIRGDNEERKPIYLPVGTFITAYSRRKTISTAQSVYHRFMYADTDSLHLEGLELPENIDISPIDLGAWDHELTFKKAKYLRAKSYVEVDMDDQLHVTCAGMPYSCHQFVTFDNFKRGMKYHGKLQQSRVLGGIVLKNIDFTIKE